MQIIPNLWFDNNAEEAVNFYVSVFKNSQITSVTHYTEAGYEIHKRPAGSVMLIEFQIDGQKFAALNGGPVFKLSEAVSFVVPCENQDEIDYYWNKLSEGGDPESQQCGWLKDKYGLSWQIVPKDLNAWMPKDNKEKSACAMDAMMQMKKLDIAKLMAA